MSKTKEASLWDASVMLTPPVFLNKSLYILLRAEKQQWPRRRPGRKGVTACVSLTLPHAGEGVLGLILHPHHHVRHAEALLVGSRGGQRSSALLEGRVADLREGVLDAHAAPGRWGRRSEGWKGGGEGKKGDGRGMRDGREDKKKEDECMDISFNVFLLRKKTKINFDISVELIT